MNLFYTPPAQIHLPDIVIYGQEAVHISKVLRHTIGDSLNITDGNGRMFTGIIKQISKSQIVVTSENVVMEKRSKPYITLCIGLIKKRDRLEFAVEKATELGADEIVIFRGENSQKQNVRIERLKAVALSALKQSLRLYLPVVRIVPSLTSLLAENKANESVVLADEMVDEKHNFSDEILNDNLLLIVGPEGGFSKNEREGLKKNTVIPYSLGRKRFRTETAAILMVDRFKNRL